MTDKPLTLEEIDGAWMIAQNHRLAGEDYTRGIRTELLLRICDAARASVALQQAPEQIEDIAKGLHYRPSWADDVPPPLAVCNCPRCGRTHKPLAANPPAAISDGWISHDDICLLARQWASAAPRMDINTPEYRINEWLKTQISTHAGDADTHGPLHAEAWADDVPGGEEPTDPIWKSMAFRRNADTHSPPHAKALDKVWEKETKGEPSHVTQTMRYERWQELLAHDAAHDKLEKEREELWHSAEEYKHWYEVTQADNTILQTQIEHLTSDGDEQIVGLRAEVAELEAAKKEIMATKDHFVGQLQASIEENKGLREALEKILNLDNTLPLSYAASTAYAALQAKGE